MTSTGDDPRDTRPVVVFDVGGVLEVGEVIDRGGRPDWLLAVGREHGWSGDEVAERLRAATVGMADDGPEAELRARYAAGLELDPTQLEAFMRRWWDWYCGELDPVMWAWADELSARYRLAICSNSADGARREEERRYGFSRLFDPIVYSHEVGVGKPDPRIFAVLCERVGRPADELIFIDDSPAVVDGARAFGIETVHHRDPATTRIQVERWLAARSTR